ncbi:hypothetical protein AX289_26995 [Methylorubrum populi]|nr:hypothetical protein AX289_26995 [Methylorubrum populi]
MSSAQRHRTFEAMTGWWATAALALVLALAIAMSTTGLASDLSHHQGHPGHDQTELSFVTDTASGVDQASDTGATGHVDCGCHVALSAVVAGGATPRNGMRPSFATLSEIVSLVSPDRLPRPPRI